MRFSRSSKIPAPAAAVLDALHLEDPRVDVFRTFTDSEWRAALDFADRSQLTLCLKRALDTAGVHAVPVWMKERLNRAAANNLERVRQARQLHRALDDQLRSAGVTYLALKGLTQCPLAGIDPGVRAQYDIDLYVPAALIEAAREAVVALGYESLRSMEKFPTDHLPALIRKTGWEWRGDFFDPEIPLAIEIHFQFWNERTERLRAKGIEQFWERRVFVEIGELKIPALAPADAIGYAALHLLKHVLQGSAKPFHVYELALCLQNHAANDALWKQWSESHSDETRRLEAAMFRLADEWFGCAMHPKAQEEIEHLPAATNAWLDDFAETPAVAIFQAVKDELWLHLSLLDSRVDRLAVLRRRLLPATMPGPVDAVHIPESQMTWGRRALKHLRYAIHVAGRIRHHAASLARLLLSLAAHRGGSRRIRRLPARTARPNQV